MKAICVYSYKMKSSNIEQSGRILIVQELGAILSQPAEIIKYMAQKIRKSIT